MPSDMNANAPVALDRAAIDHFIQHGFLRIDAAFPRAVADAARVRLWRDTGCDPGDPSGWTRPVIRLGMYSAAPFLAAANTPVLRAAFDQLAGAGRWLPCRAMGSFPIRFPAAADPGDTGWHVDVSFDYDQPDFMDWRANIGSRGRALLMLFLFSDVGPDDAPTRLLAGSHRDVARILAPAGSAGLTLRDLVPRLPEAARRPEVLATGAAGTVYLCHPFLVHAAQPHRGRRPRFMAQPPLLPAGGAHAEPGAGDATPVARAIRLALSEAG